MKKFSTDILKQLADDDEPEGYTVIYNELEDCGRWSLYYKLVFEHEGQKYITSYSRGATESQDEWPFGYDGEEKECRLAQERMAVEFY